MPLLVNLRHLANHNVRFEGELSSDELDLETKDQMVRARGPVTHDVEAQLLEASVLVRGSLQVALECQCVRCLKPFMQRLEMAEWTCLLELTGEEAVPVNSDCVDLTPLIREDILLAIPRHPVCDARCRGLAKTNLSQSKMGGPDRMNSDSSAWAALDKLKL